VRAGTTPRQPLLDHLGTIASSELAVVEAELGTVSDGAAARLPISQPGSAARKLIHTEMVADHTSVVHSHVRACAREDRLFQIGSVVTSGLERNASAAKRTGVDRQAGPEPESAPDAIAFGPSPGHAEGVRDGVKRAAAD
jgi:hypothetical protein